MSSSFQTIQELLPSLSYEELGEIKMIVDELYDRTYATTNNDFEEVQNFEETSIDNVETNIDFNI